MGIERMVRKRLNNPAYLEQVLEALEEHYADALKEGDAVRVEMFMASILLVREKLGR